MGKINIRENNGVLNFQYLWLKDQLEKIKLDPELRDIPNKELKEFLLSKYESRRIVNGRFYNNATSDNEIMNQEQFINTYLNMPYILSGYSCLYKNQHDSVNISSKALENLGDMRKFNKKKMEAAEHGSDEYIYYRILQLTYKVLMNSYYGILGEKNSVFFNPFVQNSITMTGQDLITTLIIAMENFLSNNVKFEDTDEILNFIRNVKSEEKSFSILDYLDEGISKEELFVYLLRHCKKETKVDVDLIHSIVFGLDLETVNRCFYKNQLLKLFENSWFLNKWKELIKYEYAEQPAEEIKDTLEDFKAKVIEFVFYDYLFESRYKRAMKDKRQTVTTIDTDSVFINANKDVEFITEKLSLDKTDKVQQGTIINIIINIVTEVLTMTLNTLTTNMGLVDEAKPLINTKQEFLYQKILLTQNKKNYSGIITAELGHILEYPVLDIKGLPILKKTSVPKKLRKQFTGIVEEDILKADPINIKNILNKYDDIEEQITTSLKEGKVEYLIPKNLELIESYKLPSQIDGLRGALVWNACCPDDQIVPPEKINLLKLNCVDEHDPRLEQLKTSHPDKYNAIMKTVWNYGSVEAPKIDISRFGFACIAIPKGIEQIPDWLLPFIDYKDMTNTNMAPSYILLESLGIYCDEVKTTKYKSNIISI